MNVDRNILFAQLATAIDTDGSISIILHRKTDKYINYEPLIVVTNKSYLFLEYFGKYFPFQKIQTQKQMGRSDKYYKLIMRNLNYVLKTLKEILPYLIIKHKQAKLVIEWCKSRLSYRGSYTKRELEIRKEVFNLNVTGRKWLKEKYKDYEVIPHLTRREINRRKKRDDKGRFVN